MSPDNLTVVMYHYVRPIRDSRFPRIKGLELESFREQVEYITRRYNVVTIEHVLAALRKEDELPPASALLTFDDGFADHYLHVFPHLIDRGLQGSFYVPGAVVMEKRVLDVNKIHFVLASVSSPHILVEAIERIVEDERSTKSLPSVAELRERFGEQSWGAESASAATRFDDPAVAYTKRLLQHALPGDLRDRIVNEFFERFVTSDEAGFSSELYVSLEHLREMAAAGMHIGGHGYHHRHLGGLTRDKQVADIDDGISFLEAVRGRRSPFTFSYPFGDYTSDTMELLQQRECEAAFTTRVRLASVPGDPALEIPRIDTNDLPKLAGAEPNEWTALALRGPR